MEIRIAPLRPQLACIELMRNTFQLDPTDMTRAQEVIARIAQVKNQVPVFTLSYPRDYAVLPAVVEAIRELCSSAS